MRGLIFLHFNSSSIGSLFTYMLGIDLNTSLFQMAVQLSQYCLFKMPLCPSHLRYLLYIYQIPAHNYICFWIFCCIPLISLFIYVPGLHSFTYRYRTRISSLTDEDTMCLFPNHAEAEPEMETGFLDLHHSSCPFLLCSSHLSPPLSLVRVKNLFARKRLICP